MNKTLSTLNATTIAVAIALAMPMYAMAVDQSDQETTSRPQQAQQHREQMQQHREQMQGHREQVQQQQQQARQQRTGMQSGMQPGSQRRMAGTAERPGQSVADARREAIIWTTMATNPNLRETAIEVEVRRNTAILTGSVESQVEVDLAESLARSVEGITRVENRLDIDPDLVVRTDAGQPTPRERTADRDTDRDFGTVVSDATTTAQVKSKLLWNTQTSGMDINVDTYRGRVTLEGAVESQASRQLAEQLARNTANVVDVDNRLRVDREAVAAIDDDRNYEVDPRETDQRGTAATVAGQRDDVRRADVDSDYDADRRVSRDDRIRDDDRIAIDEPARDQRRQDQRPLADTDSEQPVSDTWITTKVKSTLLFSRNVSGTDVDVETTNGIVRLTGQVDSNAARRVAIDLARDIRGVRNVDASGLTVDTVAAADDFD